MLIVLITWDQYTIKIWRHWFPLQIGSLIDVDVSYWIQIISADHFMSLIPEPSP